MYKRHIVSLRLPFDLITKLDKQAKMYGKTRAQFMEEILKKNAYNEIEYMKQNLKDAARDVQFWKNKIENFKTEKELKNL